MVASSSPNKDQCTNKEQWVRDFKLLPWNEQGLFSEYLEIGKFIDIVDCTTLTNAAQCFSLDRYYSDTIRICHVIRLRVPVSAVIRLDK